MQVRHEWAPCFDAAASLIEASRREGQPVWLHRAVQDILRDHPECGLTHEVLADIVRDLVIEQRWSLAS